MREFVRHSVFGKEPAKRMSVLFFVFFLIGIYIGWISYKSTAKENAFVIGTASDNLFMLLLQAFVLHLCLFCIFIKGCRTAFFIPKAYILSAVIPAFCGINTGKMLALQGIVGLSAGIVSYLPHYILLILMYRGIYNKVTADYKFTRTDYTKYVIILIIISVVHVFVSGTLAEMLI